MEPRGNTGQGAIHLERLGGARWKRRAFTAQSNVAPTITSRGFNPLQGIRSKRLRIEGYSRAIPSTCRRKRSGAIRPQTACSVRLRGWSSGTGIRCTCGAGFARHPRRAPKCNLVIYPYHAQLLLMFEERAVAGVRRLEAAALRRRRSEESGSGQARTVELWDFSGFSPYATESHSAAGRPGDPRAMVLGRRSFQARTR